MSAATLLRKVRTEAGLTQRALARKAGVPPSTVSRIEDGTHDPRLTMLERLLSAAGHRLVINDDVVPEAPSLAGLATAIDPLGDGGLDWTRLRGFVDWTYRHHDEICDAISVPPARSGNPLLDGLLAGMGEKLADDDDLERPRWCAAVPAMRQTWVPDGTPRMIQRALDSTPRQLRARNIMIAERDLWRRA